MNIASERIDTPALLIDLDILERNIRTMAGFFDKKRTQLRPHFKTVKCPRIAQMQIAAGAKGITCAKVSEAEVLVAGGIEDVLVANQIVEEAKIQRLIELAKCAKIIVAVDNEKNVAALSLAASKSNATLYILVEVDVGMNRCGVQTAGEALQLARQVMEADGLYFEGLQAYEGHLVLNPDEKIRRRGVEQMVERIEPIKAMLNKNSIRVNEISGGGTGTYNMTGDNTPWTEIQAGSYVFMDATYTKLGLAFENALTVLTTVIHKRDGVAITDAGLKVCSGEFGPPVIAEFPGLNVRLSEEHGTIADPDNRLNYLQKLHYIPAHCCTTVNLHDCYHCIRDGEVEDVWDITARGKSQ